VGVRVGLHVGVNVGAVVGTLVCVGVAKEVEIGDGLAPGGSVGVGMTVVFGSGFLSIHDRLYSHLVPSSLLSTTTCNFTMPSGFANEKLIWLEKSPSR